MKNFKESWLSKSIEERKDLTFPPKAIEKMIDLLDVLVVDGQSIVDIAQDVKGEFESWEGEAPANPKFTTEEVRIINKSAKAIERAVKDMKKIKFHN